MLTSLTAAAAAPLPVLLVWAGAVDILTRSIPNTVVVIIVASFVLFAGLAFMPLTQIFSHLLCAFAVLICGFALFSRSLIGGGDAKLLAGAALWFGFENLLPLLSATALAGGVLALTYLAANAMRVQAGQVSRDVATIPYGAAIAAGALAVLPDWLAAF